MTHTNHRGCRSARGLRAGLAIAAFAVAGLGRLDTAEADPRYLGEIDDALGTDCETPTRCVICHDSTLGGKGTANQSFAVTLRDLGLGSNYSRGVLTDILLSEGSGSVLPMFGDNALIPPGEDGLAESDSDGDLKFDLDELRGNVDLDIPACGNPSGDDFRSLPEYGCDGGSLTGTRSPVGAGLASLVLLGLGLAAHRRRRR